jgi:hypothetical protein
LKSLKENIEQLTALHEALTEEHLTLIDFDQIAELLTEAEKSLTGQIALQDELSQLRQDYERRIAGMAKAIAVADRAQGTASQLVDLIDSLGDLSSRELVDCYHRVAARFRDMFPASYTRNWSEGTRRGAVKHPELFK